MSLAVADFIAPAGKLQEAFFPDGDMETNITVWLAQAPAKLTGIASVYQDGAMTDWVYYRAYSYIAERLASEPDSVSVDDMSRAISMKRVEFFRKLAQDHLENFQGYISTPSSGSRPGSTYVQNQVVF